MFFPVSYIFETVFLLQEQYVTWLKLFPKQYWDPQWFTEMTPLSSLLFFLSPCTLFLSRTLSCCCDGRIASGAEVPSFSSSQSGVVSNYPACNSSVQSTRWATVSIIFASQWSDLTSLGLHSTSVRQHVQFTRRRSAVLQRLWSSWLAMAALVTVMSSALQIYD